MSSVTSQLMYIHDDGTRPWLYARPRTYKDIHKQDFGGRQEYVKVQINSGRDDPNITLDDVGFQLISNCESSLTNKEFYNCNSKVESVYYEEISKLICQTTGASYVHCFHHGTRNGSKDSKKAQRYAMDVHTDSSPSDGDVTYLDCLKNMAKKCIDTTPYRTGRYLYINAWRNISDTDVIEDNHLAVLDETSLVKPDDYVPYDFHQEGYSGTNYYLSSRNAKQHKWYYFPKMGTSEVLLFKQYDSDPTRRARMCFHAAFQDPTAPESAAPRQSIEVRCIAFFPDHSPNTCPPTNQGAQLTMSDILLSINYMAEIWPHRARQWFYGSMKKDDWESVLDELLRDKDNAYHLKKASDAERAEIRALAIEHDFASHCRRAYKRHLNK